MRTRPSRVLAGIVVMTVGLLLLGRNLGIEASMWELVVTGGVGVVGVAALALFGRGGRGWLLPLGCALLTVAGVQVLYSLEVASFWMVVGLLLVGMGGPFVGIYLRNHRRWGVLVPGYGLLMTGSSILFFGLGTPGEWAVTVGLWVVALPFFVIFVGNRRASWALLPAYLLWTLGAGLRLRATSDVYTVLPWMLWAGALPFWIAYLGDSERVWSAVVGGSLSVIGALSMLQSGQLTFWLGLSVSAGVGLVWMVVLVRRVAHQMQAKPALE